jgi:hypothetical protein
MTEPRPSGSKSNSWSTGNSIRRTKSELIGSHFTRGHMPNTGERREITKRVNAKEAEMVDQSKKLVSRTRESTADTNTKNVARSTGTNKRRLSRNP